MKIKELMERTGLSETGRAVAYIKDCLREMNMMSETHVTTERIDLTENQRYYDLPLDLVKVTDIRCKNHFNTKDEYRSIARLAFEPNIEDSDQELS
jgi:hypothetical protein|tara:strand:+ start:1873 stop:2160 length:288 start_codon:yes stop_codon:yes gene_type:complete